MSDHIVAVGDKQFTAPHILIASGSYPRIEKFPGSEFVMTSDGFFEMQELPKRMIVVGGGYIGVELAQIMAGLGVKVTLVVRSIILRQCDRDIIEALMRDMTIAGIDIRLHTSFTSIRQEEDGAYKMILKTDDAVEKSIIADKVLYAVGRPPLVDNLKLENTGIKIEKGAIVVDDF